MNYIKIQGIDLEASASIIQFSVPVSIRKSGRHVMEHASASHWRQEQLCVILALCYNTLSMSARISKKIQRKVSKIVNKTAIEKMIRFVGK